MLEYIIKFISLELKYSLYLYGGIFMLQYLAAIVSGRP